MRYSCEAGYYYAEGCAVGEEDTGGVGRTWVIRDVATNLRGGFQGGYFVLEGVSVR